MTNDSTNESENHSTGTRIRQSLEAGVSYISASSPSQAGRLSSTSKRQSLASSSFEFDSASRIVEVCMRVKRIFAVDTINQTFGAQVFLAMSWDKPYFETPPDKEMDDGDWRPEWTPKFRWQNLIELRQEEASFYVHHNKAGKAKVMGQWLVLLTLFEELELQKFPCDCQDLTVEVVMRQQTHDVQLMPFEDQDNVPLFALDEQSCYLGDFRLLRKIPYTYILYNLKDRDLGQATYSALQSKVKAVRKSSYYVMNVTCVMFIIVTFSLSSFALHPVNLDGRFSNDFQLILTTVAFKLVLNSLLPPVSYLTVLDVYMVGCFLYQGLVTTYHSIFPWLCGVSMISASPLTLPPTEYIIGTVDEQVILDVDKIGFYVFAAIWTIFNLWYLYYFRYGAYLTERKFVEEAQQMRDEAFTNMQGIHQALQRYNNVESLLQNGALKSPLTDKSENIPVKTKRYRKPIVDVNHTNKNVDQSRPTTMSTNTSSDSNLTKGSVQRAVQGPEVALDTVLPEHKSQEEKRAVSEEPVPEALDEALNDIQLEAMREEAARLELAVLDAAQAMERHWHEVQEVEDSAGVSGRLV